MHYAARAIISALLIGLLSGQLSSALAAGPGRLSVPPDSFINQHVASVPQLTQQVSLDPVVRRRLARHFHMSGPAMVRYIQSNLALKKTLVSRRYLVYCITRSGREYTVWSHLPAGTPIFVLKPTDQPILKLACGNPMVASLPPLEQNKPHPLSPPKTASSPNSSKTSKPPSLATNAPHTIALSSQPISPLIPTVKVASFPLQGLGGGGGSGGSLGYLAILPFLSPIFHSNGSGNGNVTPFNSTTGTDTGLTGVTGTSTGVTGTSTGVTGTSTGVTGTSTGTNGDIGTNGNNLMPESSGLVNMVSVLLALGVVVLCGQVRRKCRKRMRGNRGPM